jgi:hypothetical protein
VAAGLTMNRTREFTVCAAATLAAVASPSELGLSGSAAIRADSVAAPRPVVATRLFLAFCDAFTFAASSSPFVLRLFSPTTVAPEHNMPGQRPMVTKCPSHHVFLFYRPYGAPVNSRMSSPAFESETYTSPCRSTNTSVDETTLRPSSRALVVGAGGTK